MTLEEKRIAVAEWSGIRPPEQHVTLDWLHECEKKLNESQWEDYAYAVAESEIPCDDGTIEQWTLFEEYGWYGLLKATAEQRLDALVKMIGQAAKKALTELQNGKGTK